MEALVNDHPHKRRSFA
jgi:hypothetical protein